MTQLVIPPYHSQTPISDADFTRPLIGRSATVRFQIPILIWNISDSAARLFFPYLLGDVELSALLGLIYHSELRENT